jgi:hypothetical protein
MLSRNLEPEEAKARYRDVKIKPDRVVTPGKQTMFRYPSVSSYRYFPTYS